jgi:hypothetical protein
MNKRGVVLIRSVAESVYSLVDDFLDPEHHAFQLLADYFRFTINLTVHTGNHSQQIHTR